LHVAPRQSALEQHAAAGAPPGPMPHDAGAVQRGDGMMLVQQISFG
jgi:hypothetical protein